MTKDELKRAIYKLDITQTKLAEECGVARRTVYHWTAGTRSVPGYAEIIINKLLEERTK